MKILAIETSCDETAVAILAAHPNGRASPKRREATGSKQKPVFRLLSNVVSSQVKIHKPFGGVVPNLAQREHQRNLVPVLLQALREAKILVKSDKWLVTSKKTKIVQQKLATRHSTLATILEREPKLFTLFQKYIVPVCAPKIDAIAVTRGPGLEPTLWVGINFAKALSLLWNKPLIPVNHLEGHIYASWLPGKSDEFLASLVTRHYPKFPLLALIVSGGHTELVLVKKHLDYEVLGETRDDAAGEAFDKVAKMLGLGYPGGPEIARLAEKGNPNTIAFPRPMIHSKNFDFSFSGLKTAVLYHLKDRNFLDENSRRGRAKIFASPSCASSDGGVKEFPDEKFLSKADIAASFEQAVVDVLVSKTSRALRQYGAKALVVGGGAAANKKLRSSLEQLVTNHYPLVTLYLSPLWLCGDNAAMIAVAAYFRSLQKQKPDVAKIRANGNLKLQ